MMGDSRTVYDSDGGGCDAEALFDASAWAEKTMLFTKRHERIGRLRAVGEVYTNHVARTP
jgi:hypothetical protein